MYLNSTVLKNEQKLSAAGVYFWTVVEPITLVHELF